VVRGQARFESATQLRVRERILSAPRIFINVGARAIVPDIPGISAVPYLTNSTIVELDRVPEHLVILGGSYIGLEFAQMYRRFGSGRDRGGARAADRDGARIRISRRRSAKFSKPKVSGFAPLPR